ncbi:MAG: flagellar protein FlaG [Treponema sp.]|nr:flagellar protein FlaG [Treponema sp.]
MPITSMGSTASLIPSLEHQGRDARTTEPRERITLAQAVVSVLGDGEQRSSEEQEQNRMADAIGFGLTYNRRLQFVVDHDSNEVIVKVIDNDTDEVVRVLPPEELQRLYRGQQEGSLLSERV